MVLGEWWPSGRSKARPVLACLVAVALLASSRAADTPKAEDDANFRPTVMIRQGKSLGTGTIIASVEGETLVLTASHVVDESDAAVVEINRFNLGLERLPSSFGFPKKLEAAVVARSIDADLAILRVRGQLALPFVARIASAEAPPPPGTKVTTIGFDRGARLIGFSTRVRSTERVDLDKGGGPRPFLVTDDPPELGRSGGGLFRLDGSLVGVCVGRFQGEGGKSKGLFSELANVKGLIRADERLRTSMARASTRPKSAAR